jgi:hypothetical protein
MLFCLDVTVVVQCCFVWTLLLLYNVVLSGRYCCCTMLSCLDVTVVVQCCLVWTLLLLYNVVLSGRYCCCTMLFCLDVTVVSSFVFCFMLLFVLLYFVCLELSVYLKITFHFFRVNLNLFGVVY